MARKKEIKFFELGDCEVCGEQKMLNRAGACERCVANMEHVRSDPSLLKARLGQLARSENGLRRANRNKMLLDTAQPTSSEKFRWDRIPAMAERDAGFTKKQVTALIAATPEEISDKRTDNPCEAVLVAANAELIKYIAKHPKAMHELSPSKFEELIAEILRDQGHTIHRTPLTRDKGRDILAALKTPLGEILTIVECKRHRSDRKVGISIIERFLHTIRDGDKANRGLIVTTSQFSPDSIKKAAQYNLLLKLSDFNNVHAMAQHYGTWMDAPKKELWVPNFVIEYPAK